VVNYKKDGAVRLWEIRGMGKGGRNRNAARSLSSLSYEKKIVTKKGFEDKGAGGE